MGQSDPVLLDILDNRRRATDVDDGVSTQAPLGCLRLRGSRLLFDFEPLSSSKGSRDLARMWGFMLLSH